MYKIGKLLLLLTAHYYMIQAESSVDVNYTINFYCNSTDLITVNQLYEPDYSSCFPSFFTNILNPENYLYKQWRLRLLHDNRFIVNKFTIYLKKISQNSLTSRLTYTHTIEYVKESNGIPLSIINKFYTV